MSKASKRMSDWIRRAAGLVVAEPPTEPPTPPTPETEPTAAQRMNAWIRNHGKKEGNA